MRITHLFLLLALNVGWAAIPTVATRLETMLSVREFVFLRYGIAALSLAAIWPWLPGRLPRGLDFWRTAAMGVIVFTLGHQLQVAGIQRGQATDASVLLALDPLISSIGAAIFLHERIPLHHWMGFALAIFGVVLLSMWSPVRPLPGLVANLMIVGSFVTEAAWSVMGKPLIVRWGIPKVVALALWAGTLSNLLLMADDPGWHVRAIVGLPASVWVIFGVLGLVLSAFGYSLWYRVIRDAPVSLAALTIYLQPIVGTALAVALVGETLHWGHLWGSLAISAGLLVGMLWTGRSPRATPPAFSTMKPESPADGA